MLITHVQHAPEDSAFSRTAFDSSLGKTLPLKIDGETIGEATLLGAIPSEDHRSVTLTWEVDEIRAEFLNEPIIVDDFVPNDALNPAAAIAVVQRADRAVDPLREFEMFAYVGFDELGSGELGLKAAFVPAGYIPLVSTEREKLDQPAIVVQLSRQSRRFGKTISLVRMRYVETVFDIEVTHLPECPRVMFPADPDVECRCDDNSPTE
jgi:hypothetical protein